MNIAFVVYDGMTFLDLIGVYDPISRLRSMGFLPDLKWDFCASRSTDLEKADRTQSMTGSSSPVKDTSGLEILPNKINQSLASYDYVIVPGGLSSRTLIHNSTFLDWLRSAGTTSCLASVGSGTLLLAGAGLLEGKYAATHPDTTELLEQMGIKVLKTRLVEDGNFLSSSGVTAGLDMGLYLCRQLAGIDAAEKIRQQMDYPLPMILPVHPSSIRNEASRIARVSRQTAETNIDVTLRLDGTGQYQIDTGLPFLDHMLAQVAVHGLFDLVIQARGDLLIDPHHTLEDTALALGQSFKEALGDRSGITRIASAVCPMDESLARVAVDFSGRPYTVIKGEWHLPEVGGLPVSLIPHFFESFASQALCNLHAEIQYGRDDHHQAEALFKAFGRALLNATRLDPRRAGIIPSTKGKIV